MEVFAFFMFLDWATDVELSCTLILSRAGISMLFQISVTSWPCHGRVAGMDACFQRLHGGMMLFRSSIGPLMLS